MPGITANCLSGLGSASKNFIRSSKLAMPSYSPRMTMVGTVILVGSTTGRCVAHVDIGAVRDRIVELEDVRRRTPRSRCRRRCRDGRARRSSARTCGRSAAAWSSGTPAASCGARASVGLPSPVHTWASSASRFTRFGMPLREQRRAQRAGRDAVDQQRAGVVAGLEDVVGRRPRGRRRPRRCWRRCRGSWSERP